MPAAKELLRTLSTEQFSAVHRFVAEVGSCSTSSNVEPAASPGWIAVPAGGLKAWLLPQLNLLQTIPGIDDQGVKPRHARWWRSDCVHDSHRQRGATVSASWVGHLCPGNNENRAGKRKSGRIRRGNAAGCAGFWLCEFAQRQVPERAARSRPSSRCWPSASGCTRSPVRGAGAQDAERSTRWPRLGFLHYQVHAVDFAALVAWKLHPTAMDEDTAKVSASSDSHGGLKLTIR